MESLLAAHFGVTWIIASVCVACGALGAYFLLCNRNIDGRSALIIVVITAMVMTPGYVISNQLVQSEHDRIAQRLKMLGPIYAGELVNLGLGTVTFETKADDPAYLRCIEAQKRWLASNVDVADIYVMAKDDQGKIRFLIDSETDYNQNGVFDVDDAREARTEIGEEYTSASLSMQLAFRGFASFDESPTTDRWGTWVSLAHPIADKAQQVQYVLGIDFPGRAYLQQMFSIRFQSLSLAVLVSLVASLATGFILSLASRLRLKSHQAELLRTREEAAQAGSRAKSEFLANMSHELRTPMTAIMGYSELLVSQEVGPIDQEQYIRTIHRNGEHLLTIINDILDISAIEAGTLALQRSNVDPCQLVHDVVSLMSVRADQKDLRLFIEPQFPLPEAVNLDPVRMRQILMNLIGNAIKFTDKGSVCVRLMYEHTATSRALLIDIIDTGTGMDESQLEKLFRTFSQVDYSLTRRHGGTGLGLAISRKLARALGGDIAVASQPNKGSTFSVRFAISESAQIKLIDNAEVFTCQTPLPTQTTSAQAAHSPATTPSCDATDTSPQNTSVQIMPAKPAPAPTPSLAGCSVLLAEDGPDNQRLISMILRKAGAKVTVVENGKKAFDAALVAAADDMPFDVILMDMQMPELDGYAATSLLRQRGYTLPIVALTAHALTEDRTKCIDAGCDDYSTKPVSKETLISLVQSWRIKTKQAA